MISKEKFQELEYQYGCGYWNVCWEHACPCAITTENKGYSEEIYNSLLQESREVTEMYSQEDEDNFYDDMEEFEQLFDYDEDEEFDCDNVEGGCGCCSYERPICAKYFEEE